LPDEARGAMARCSLAAQAALAAFAMGVRASPRGDMLFWRSPVFDFAPGSRIEMIT